MTGDIRSPDVVTVTLNPAIDLTVAVDRFVVGTVQRARTAVSTVGGKGINVAGCLADWGAAVAVTGVLGRANDVAFADFFAEKKIADRFVRTAGETRTNIKIADLATGDTTDLNLPGLTFAEGTFDAVRATLMRSAAPGRPVVLAGSLPDGLPESAWSTLIDDLARLDARVVLDTSGHPLAAALAGATLPHAIKPNAHELEQLLGRPLPTIADLVAAARDLVRRGVALVVVSRGAEGALFVDAETALAARLPAMTVLSTVGAGDAMVAGVVAGLVEGAALDRLARLAVAFATAKLQRIGPHLGSPALVASLAERVDVTVLPH
ncbi:MAG: 1-phosphofructokinase [Siculibacillus sp.]